MDDNLRLDGDVMTNADDDGCCPGCGAAPGFTGVECDICDEKALDRLAFVIARARLRSGVPTFVDYKIARAVLAEDRLDYAERAIGTPDGR